VDLESAPAESEKDKSLTDYSLSGFSWLAGRTVITRVVQYGGQIVLAWLLEPKAFGLIGMAYSIQAFATLVQQSGIDKVLVAKQDHFEELANPGFWGALATGLAAAGLMALSAPIAADMLNSPDLTELLLILAVATPFKTLWLVPQSRLSIDVRFDLKTIVNTGATIAQMGLAIILADLVAHPDYW
jgi:PST family polysaccharide transporter